MKLFSTSDKFEKNYFSALLALIPISFIAGNLIININLVLIVLSTLIIYGKNLFQLRYYLLDKGIFMFFLLILLTGLYNDFILYNFYNDYSVLRGVFGTTLKSIFFLKYLLLYLSLRFLVEKQIISLKLFFLSSTIASLFVCFDIFFQFKFGQDIFGFKTFNDNKLGGPFGDELIAGGYLQRFSIFAFFLLPFFYPEKSQKITKYLLPILFLIFIIGIILSGNRMPLILFLFTIILITIFNKQIRKYLIPFIVIFSLVFTIILKSNVQIRHNFLSFYNQVSKISVAIINKDFNNKNNPQYLKEFATFYDTWRMSKYIGGGIKNFRYYCHFRDNIDKDSEFKCNMHPHNYYLEILTETGLVGFFIILFIFSSILYLTLYRKYFSNSELNKNNFIIPFIFLFIIEIFPIKSTGSFFTTGSTTYLILIIAILIGIVRRHYSIENKL